MTLGYALLHANQIETALDAHFASKDRGDEGVDVGMCALVMPEPEAVIRDYLRGVIDQLRAVAERVQGAFDGGVGVLGEIARLAEEFRTASFDDFRLEPWVERIAGLITLIEPTALGERLDGLFERVAVAFPELNGGGLLDTILDVLLGGLDALERPRLDGRDDVTAHRTFRAARIVRAWLAQALSGVREFLAQFDLMAWLRAALRQMMGRLRGPDPGVLAGVADALRSYAGPVARAIDALLEVRVSVSVNVDAELETDPEGEPCWIDDYKVAPHDWKHALWWTDLLTNTSALLLDIYDYQRFAPFHPSRAADALFGALNLAWQTVRTIMRAVRPDFLKLNDWKKGGQFLFSELGDFSIQAFLCLLGSFHEAPDHGSNWVMSFASRLGRYYTFHLQPRLPYIFGRAVWYMRSWSEQGWVIEYTVQAGDTLESIAVAQDVEVDELRYWNRLDDDEQPEAGRVLIIVPDDPGPGPGRVRAKVAFARYHWIGWFFMFVVGAVTGMAQGWEDMQVDALGDTDFFKASLWVGLSVGLAAFFCFPPLFAWAWPWDEDMLFETDYLSFGFLLGTFVVVLALVAGSMSSTNVTAELWWIPVVALVVLFGLFFLPVFWIWGDWTDGSGDKLNTATMFLWVFCLLVGLVLFCVLPMILWWMYIDDGRDKLGQFRDLDASTSPFMLPWPGGKMWICGQGFHGIFSHYSRSPANVFGYDFLEGKDEPAVASRSGLVISVVQFNPYGGGQNDVQIQHLDWVEGHDPGTDDERVQTYSHYIHIGPQNARIALNQYIRQGQNIVDIDSTGISAQHHLHHGFGPTPGFRIASHPLLPPPGRNTAFDALDSQSLPLLFADDTLRRDRTFPLLRWIEGRIHYDGKPLSQCLYESKNTLKADGTSRPLRLQTVEVGPDRPGSGHSHWLEIDATSLELNGGIKAGQSPLRTTVAAGHSHEVNIDAGRIRALLHHEAPDFATEAALSDALQHSHGFRAEAFDGGDATAAVGVDAPIGQVGVTAPPPGQVIATKEGPYDLLGGRLVARVDGRATEFFHFGGSRARLVGDVVVDRGARAAANLNILNAGGGNMGSPSTSADGRSPRAAAAELSRDGALVNQPCCVRAVPVIVVETKTRGRSARLELDGNSSAKDAFGLAANVVAEGAGAFDNQRAVARADLVALFERGLNNLPAAPPPPAPPAAGTVHVAAVGGNLDIGGNAVTATGNPRHVAVFSGLYDAATTTLTGTGDLPLGPGRLTLTPAGGGAALEVPIAGTPAALEIDPGPAWLEPAKVAGSTLKITVGTSEIGLRLPNNANLDRVATAIVREVEGVRAWNQGGKLWIETTEVGASATLRVRKAKPEGEAGADFDTSATGEAPKLAGGDAIEDSALVQRGELVRLVNDAHAHALLRQGLAAAFAGGAKVQVNVAITDNKLALSVPAGKTIALVQADCSQALLRALGQEGANPPNFEQVSANEIRSRQLADPFELPVGGWLDVNVDGDVRRVELDAWPARLELNPVEGWPANGEELRLKIGGGAFQAASMNGCDSLAEIADALAGLSPELVVRIASRISVEHAFVGGAGLRLTNSVARSALGFLSQGTLQDNRGGGSTDLCALGSAMDNGTTGLSAARRSAPGVRRITGYTTALGGAAPNHSVDLDPPDNYEIAVDHLGPGGADPFGFGGAPVALERSAGFEHRPLGGRVADYEVRLYETGVHGVVVGRSFVQVSAAPARLRGSAPAGVLPLAGETLQVRVTRPDPGGGAARVFSVDLSFEWAVQLREDVAAGAPAAVQAARSALDQQLRERLVDQIQREVPLVHARLIPTGDGQRERVEIETVGAGRAWRLRLEGAAALTALGFELAGGVNHLEAEGGGNVDDEARVSHGELRAAFDGAAAYMTLAEPTSKYHVHNPAAASPDHDHLRLSASDAAITVVAEPEALALALAPIQHGDEVEIDASSDLDLVGGHIIVQRDGDAAAVVPVHGTRASAHSPGAVPAAGSADEAAELNFLQGLSAGQEIEIEVDGATTHHVTGFAGLTSIEAVVAHIARSAPEARVGLRSSGVGAGKELFVESRTRGSDSEIALRFVGFVPTATAHGTLLGCTANLSQSGSGSFPKLAAVTAAQLEAALKDARSRSVVAQSLVAARADGARVEISAGDPSADLTKVADPVRRDGTNVSFGAVANRPDQLEANLPGTVDLRSGIVELTWETTAQHVGGTSIQRTVRTSLWGAPARLTLGVNAAVPAAFDNHRLALSIDGDAFNVDFSGLSSWPALAVAIEQASDWRMLAQVRGTGADRVLELSTAGEGEAVRLALRRASGATDARDLLDDPAEAVVSRAGLGFAPRLDRADAASLAAALSGGYASEDATVDASDPDFVTASHQAYRAKLATRSVPLLRLRSRRRGSMSHVEILDGDAALEVELSLARGPASRAAVVIAKPAGAINLGAEATLVVRFDDNGAGAGVSPPRDIEVRFAAGPHSWAAIVERLQEVLYGAGAGTAVAFPDEALVIETATPGLAGSVRVPGAGSDAAIVAALGLDAASPREARGWPGGDRLEDTEALRTGTTMAPAGVNMGNNYIAVRGYRGKVAGAATANVEWRFHDNLPTAGGVNSTPNLVLNAAWSTQQLATEVDAILARAGAGGNLRIGHAKRGTDDTLQIEPMEGRFLYLQVKPAGGAWGPVGNVVPTGLGERVDVAEEPGLDLRSTDTLRTYRHVYDRRGLADVATAGDFVDMRWLRPPTDPNTGLARRRDNYEPYDVYAWVRGRHLLAARAEAAKHDYGDAAEMIVSAGSANIGGKDVHFAHVARYWVGLTCMDRWNRQYYNSANDQVAIIPVMLGVRSFAGELLTDWLV